MNMHIATDTANGMGLGPGALPWTGIGLAQRVCRPSCRRFAAGRAGVPAGRGSAGPIAERNARIGRRALPLQAVPRDNGGLMSSPTSSKPSRPGADEAAAPSARPVLRRPEKPQAELAGDARRPSGGAGRSAGARGPRNDRNDRNERGGRNERYERSDRRDAGPRGDARDAAPRGDARDQRPRSSGFGRAEDLDRSQPRGDWRGQGGGENRAPREQRDPRDARDTRHAGDMRDSRPRVRPARMIAATGPMASATSVRVMGNVTAPGGRLP